LEKKKLVPERMCMVCRQKNDKSNLIRVVKQKDNSICIDLSHKMNGRGSYICNNSDCIQKTIKTQALNRAFKMQIDASVYEEIKNVYGCEKN